MGFCKLPYLSKKRQRQQPNPNHRREEKEVQDLPLYHPGHHRGQHLRVQDDCGHHRGQHLRVQDDCGGHKNCYLNSLFDHCSQFLR